MPAYVIAQIDIHDAAGYQAYLDGFPAIFQRYDGRLLVTTRQKTDVVEGSWPFPGSVVIEFADMATARAWYNDPDYQALVQTRWKTARTNMVFVEGYTEAPD